MKKITAIFLTVIMLAACGGAAQPSSVGNSDTGSSNTGSSDAGFNTAAESRESEKTNRPESTETLSEIADEGKLSDEALDGPSEKEESAEVNREGRAEGAKILVAYFSATNTTKGVAEKLADGLGADLYRIVPENPYTDADLNYHNNSSRTSIEMNDPDVRPAISGAVENMEQYEVIFLGYPIWWGEAPRIINTFVESYDFSGKTIVPFCTSGSSGIGNSGVNLHSAAAGAVWLDGMRFSGSVSEDELMKWADELGL